MKNVFTSKKVLISFAALMVLLIVLGTLTVLSMRPGGFDGDPATGRGPLFPLGGSRGPTTPTAPEGSDIDGVITTTPGMRPALWRVSERPTVAAIAYGTTNRSDDEVWYIRYVERETMHVYEQEVVSRGRVRLSITNVPRIQEAFFLPGYPNRFVIRYLDSSAQNVQTYRATLTPRNPENPPRTDEEKENAYSINGSFLEQNIRSIAPGAGATIAYTVREANGSAVKVVNAEGGVSTAYTTPLRELIVSYPLSSTLLVTTKAAYNTNGVAMRVDTGSGNGRILLTEWPSLLTSMSPRGDRFIAFTNGRNGGARLALYNADGTHRSDMSLVTIPEKCTWSIDVPSVVYCAVPSTIPSAHFPDTWYQGVTHTQDLLWKIDTETNTTTLLAGQADFIREGAEEPLDIINLAVSENDQYLTFIDRKTDELWALRLFTPEL